MKIKSNNVQVSLRLNSAQLARVDSLIDGRSRSGWVAVAIEERLEREAQIPEVRCWIDKFERYAPKVPWAHEEPLKFFFGIAGLEFKYVENVQLESEEWVMAMHFKDFKFAVYINDIEILDASKFADEIFVYTGKRIPHLDDLEQGVLAKQLDIARCISDDARAY